jgi:hypothetical protein
MLFGCVFYLRCIANPLRTNFVFVLALFPPDPPTYQPLVGTGKVEQLVHTVCQQSLYSLCCTPYGGKANPACPPLHLFPALLGEVDQVESWTAGNTIGGQLTPPPYGGT